MDIQDIAARIIYTIFILFLFAYFSVMTLLLAR